MNLLKAIIKQDLKISKEQEKLKDLHNQYVNENRKYDDDTFVTFSDFGTKKNGQIVFARFRDDHTGTGICYTVFVITKMGIRSKADRNHYYIFENDLIPIK
jgi:hypothetical protein